MADAQELVDYAVGVYRLPAGYIWGSYGQTWTKEKQQAATRETTKKYGSKWIGMRVWDCSGIPYAFFRDRGLSPNYHGSNSQWKQCLTVKGKLDKKTGERTDGEHLKWGSAVFLVDKSGNRHHVGTYVGHGCVVEAKGTIYGVVTSDITHWDEWGEWKNVDYSKGCVCDLMATVKRGDSGVTVKDLQTRLNLAGYDCGEVDGKFGAKTESALKRFQKANGLKDDGICGNASWAALIAATEDDFPFDDSENGDTPDPEKPGVPDDKEQIIEYATGILNDLYSAENKTRTLIERLRG